MQAVFFAKRIVFNMVKLRSILKRIKEMSVGAQKTTFYPRLFTRNPQLTAFQQNQQKHRPSTSYTLCIGLHKPGLLPVKPNM